MKKYAIIYVLTRTLLERLGWMTLILIAFTYSAIFIYNSIQEARDNPVASVVEVMDAASLPFPTVTVYPGRRGAKEEKDKQHSSYRFVATALNALEFGCRESKTTEPDCLDRAKKTREDFRPVVKSLMHALVDIWNEEASSGNHVLSMDMMLKYIPHSWFFDAICKLSQIWPDGPDDDQAGDFEDVLADTFERSERSKEKIIGEYLDNLAAAALSSNGTINGTCSVEQVLSSHLSGWVSAIWFHWQAEKRGPNIPLGNLLEFMYILDHGFGPYPFYLHVNGEQLTDLADDMLDSLCRDECMVTPWEVLDYTERGKLSTFRSNFKEFSLGKACGHLYVFAGQEGNLTLYEECMRQNVALDPDYFLRVMKYHYQAVKTNITATGYLTDMKIALELTDHSLACDPTKLECRHSDPLLQYCYFGYSENSLRLRESYKIEDDCSSFQMTYGFNGLAYTFNGPDFWSMYANNTYNKAFFSEIYHREDTYERLANGKVLEFYIFPEASEIFFGKAPSASLAIHHHTLFPSIPISLEPGFR